jgi:hypothetical protein
LQVKPILSIFHMWKVKSRLRVTITMKKKYILKNWKSLNRDWNRMTESATVEQIHLLITRFGVSRAAVSGTPKSERIKLQCKIYVKLSLFSNIHFIFDHFFSYILQLQSFFLPSQVFDKFVFKCIVVREKATRYDENVRWA